MNNQPLTTEQKDRAKWLLRKGATYREAGTSIGRSEAAIRKWAKRGGWTAIKSGTRSSITLEVEKLTEGFTREDLVAHVVEMTIAIRGVENDSFDDDFPLAMNLTVQERCVLHALWMAQGRVFTKNQILNALYGPYDHRGNKIVDVVICRLRRKIKNLPWQINTIWARGYNLDRKNGAE